MAAIARVVVVQKVLGVDSTPNLLPASILDRIWQVVVRLCCFRRVVHVECLYNLSVSLTPIRVVVLAIERVSAPAAPVF